VNGLAISINFGDTNIGDYPILISPATEMIRQIQDPGPDDAVSPSSSPATYVHGQGPSSISKTFDLLLGVHLPVSVSFGKTSLMVKEVLKLTTGSIVELNRIVTEPVDIIVNNCIIARGDVVVVSGNYGVRVREIVSREQRYQTGISPGVTKH
jgi:flagellar motor switch protein FliN